MRSNEPELRTLMLAGLNGDAAAHTQLLERMSGHLQGYFRGALARVGRGPAGGPIALCALVGAVLGPRLLRW